jgi:hypothetical protein
VKKEKLNLSIFLFYKEKCGLNNFILNNNREIINLLENNTIEGDSPVIYFKVLEVNKIVGVELFESIVLKRW